MDRCKRPGYHFVVLTAQPHGLPNMMTTLAESLRNDTLNRIRLRKVCSVAPTASIEEVVACLVSNRIGCALVMDGTAMLGIFTERDF